MSIDLKKDNTAITPPPESNVPSITNESVTKTKFCKHCGTKIPEKAVICSACGCQVEELQSSANQPNIVINNTNNNTNNAGVVGVGGMMEKNKWVALVLCLLFGWIGAHKFYEGKIVMGIVYLCTCGLFFIGVIVDLISILSKPNPYYLSY